MVHKSQGERNAEGARTLGLEPRTSGIRGLASAVCLLPPPEMEMEEMEMDKMEMEVEMDKMNEMEMEMDKMEMEI